MKRLMMKILLIFLIFPLVICLSVANSDATAIILTSAGASDTVNGSIFTIPGTLIDASGTGVIDSFLRIQGSGDFESGYNTGGTLEFDTKSGIFTHPIQLNDIQNNIVYVDGISYYEFVLDINETTPNPLITLMDFEFYMDANPDNTGYPNIGTLVYDFDVGPDGESSVTMTYELYAGSGGQLDLFALVPTSYFGTNLDQYIYLYSSFGQPDGVDDGFEEWAHKTEGTFTPGGPGPSVPEPGSLCLSLGALFLIFGIGAKRKREV